ncbi:MAG: NIPSNAP family protein [Alphaproteobacteria bacterium]|nr:NIPSNAP family protein [Alphaproteobacteria bacterium]
MIHELRTYTLRPGSAAEVMRNSGEVARPIRGDDYGTLEGYWMTDIGPLNRVMHLWSYADLNQRQRLRAALAENQAWVNDYLPLIRPHLVRQEIRLLRPVAPLKAPAAEGNVYEFRNYRIAAGKAAEWVSHVERARAVREKYSLIVGLWITEAPEPNEVCHIWAYDDLNARAAARAGAAQDPEWQELLAKAMPLIEEMHSTVMLPAPFSPLR